MSPAHNNLVTNPLGRQRRGVRSLVAVRPTSELENAAGDGENPFRRGAELCSVLFCLILMRFKHGMKSNLKLSRRVPLVG